MANNVLTGPNVVLAKLGVDNTPAEVGLNSGNLVEAFLISADGLKSFQPSRPSNSLNRFVYPNGYYLVMKAGADISNYFYSATTVDSGGGSTSSLYYETGYFEDGLFE